MSTSPEKSRKNHECRVVWLLPVANFYWQPTISEFTKIFPRTKVLAGAFPGFAKGFEGGVDVEVVGQFKRVGIRAKDTAPGYSYSFTALSLKVIQPLLRFKPDVIISTSFGIWTLIALLLKSWMKWRVILAYEGSSPGVDFLNSPIRLSVRRSMVKAANACITNSQAGKTYLVEVLNANKEQVFVHPYEVPAAQSLTQGPRPLLGMKQLQHPVFLFVGRIIPRKGLNFLIEACSILQEQGYQDFTLLIVGGGSQQKELESLCQEKCLNCVQWMGKVEYKNVSYYYNEADIFILPTLEDTWGVVVLEAMLLGKPVLCSIRAGSAELIVNGENGYIFHPDQPQQLAELMLRFINNHDLISAIGSNSQRTMQAYTPEIAAKFLSQVLDFAMV